MKPVQTLETVYNKICEQEKLAISLRVVKLGFTRAEKLSIAHAFAQQAVAEQNAQHTMTYADYLAYALANVAAIYASVKYANYVSSQLKTSSSVWIRASSEIAYTAYGIRKMGENTLVS